MKAKSSIRLRLECLETRNLLSAVTLPLLPAATSLDLASAGEFGRVAEQGLAHAAMTPMPSLGLRVLTVPSQNVGATVHDAGPSAAVTPPANPPVLPDQLVPDAVSATNAVAPTPASLTLVPDRLSSGQDLVTYVQPAAGGQDSGRAPVHDLSPSDDSMYDSRPILYNVGDKWSMPTASTTQDQPPAELPDDVASDVPPVDPDLASHGQYYVVEFAMGTAPPGRGSAGFPESLGRTAGVPAPPIAGGDNSVPPSMEFSAQPVKDAPADASPASNASRTGLDAFAYMETSPASNYTTNLSATNWVSPDTTTSSSTEGGFIVLENPPVIASQLAGPPSYYSGPQTASGVSANRMNWQMDSAPNLRTPVDTGSSDNKAARSSKSLTADSPQQPAMVVSQAVADLEEGDGIELATTGLAGVSAGDESAGESTAADAAPQLSDIQSESGVGLFCDIEVAGGPSLPLGDSASNAVSRPNDVALTVVPGSGRDPEYWVPQAGAVAAIAPPWTESWQPTFAGLDGQWPLFLGVTVLASWGGLRLEERISARERRLFVFNHPPKKLL